MINARPRCRSCNAESIKQTIRSENVFGGLDKHKFWQCNDCGLVYLWPVPSKKDEKLFYAKEFEKYMSKRSGGDKNWLCAAAHKKANQDHIKRRWKFLKKHISSKRSILEIGCSSGFMMDAFRSAGMETVGIEPSKHFMEFLIEKGYTVYNSLKQLKLNDSMKKFDLIVHFFVLEHIRDTEYFIKEQLELLNPKGLIIAEVPCVNDPLISVFRISAFERFYWSIAHHYYFSPKSLSKILDRIDCEYEFVPEQRYDLSNHMVWMMNGKSGGQNHYSHLFSKETLRNYKNDLKRSWNCDTFFVYIKPKIKE